MLLLVNSTVHTEEMCNDSDDSGLVLTNTVALLFLLQQVQRRAPLGRPVVHLGQGLLLMVLVVTGTH